MFYKIRLRVIENKTISCGELARRIFPRWGHFPTNFQYAGIVFTQWSKTFSPAGGHIALINVKFGTGERTAGLLPVPNFTFYGAKMWEYSFQNCQNVDFLRSSYASIGSF